MKKLVAFMLGLWFLDSAVAVSFAYDSTDGKSSNSKDRTHSPLVKKTKKKTGATGKTGTTGG